MFFLALDDNPNRRVTYAMLANEFDRITGHCEFKFISDDAEATAFIRDSDVAADVVVVDYFWRESRPDAEEVEVERGPALAELAARQFPDARVVLLTSRVDAPEGMAVTAFLRAGGLAMTLSDMFKELENVAEGLAGDRVGVGNSVSPFSISRSSDDEPIELLTTDIVKSSIDGIELQIDRLSRLLGIVGKACTVLPSDQIWRWQFTGDGMILSFPRVTRSGIALEVGKKLYEGMQRERFEIRTLVNVGRATHVEFENGRSEMIGYVVNSTCHLLAAVDDGGLYMTREYYSTALGGQPGEEDQAKWEPTQVIAKHVGEVEILRHG